jgi:ferredoxin
MIKVTIINDGMSFEVPKSSRIADYLPDECGIMFGCRRGTCGTCLCTIRNGGENLAAVTQQEEETVRKAGGSPNQRLACRLWTREIEKEGEIEIEY